MLNNIMWLVQRLVTHKAYVIELKFLYICHLHERWPALLRTYKTSNCPSKIRMVISQFVCCIITTYCMPCVSLRCSDEKDGKTEISLWEKN
jgi:hypothetical protein